jgi:hypothetical protein
MVILDMLVAALTTELIRVLLTRYTLVLTKLDERLFGAEARASYLAICASTDGCELLESDIYGVVGRKEDYIAKRCFTQLNMRVG